MFDILTFWGLISLFILLQPARAKPSRWPGTRQGTREQKRCNGRDAGANSEFGIRSRGGGGVWAARDGGFGGGLVVARSGWVALRGGGTTPRMQPSLPARERSRSLDR
ncbi:hypothetical protein B0I37DRAFT_92561 [Chaetomium sp. MPI-CAGE-AT-0009]|nr:hypothetical protein B0I37DRAFT_92561 [Chaetomium sp. MPI-CAGE-AT-0009]